MLSFFSKKDSFSKIFSDPAQSNRVEDSNYLDVLEKLNNLLKYSPKNQKLNDYFLEFPEEFKEPCSNVLENEYAERFGFDISNLIKDDSNEFNELDNWLKSECEKHSKIIGSLDSKILYDEIIRICESKQSQEELEMKLFDLIGEANFDLLMSIVQISDKLRNLQSYNEKNRDQNNISNSQKKSRNYLSVNQRVKLEKKEKEESESALSAVKAFENPLTTDWLLKLGFSEDYLNEERALGLQKNRNVDSWLENLLPSGSTQYYEKKGLPAGTTRKTGPGYEEVFIPAAKRPPPPKENDLVNVQMLEPWAQTTFEDTKFLNRIQSKVFPCAYYSNENMLVCAPTGAGKTNIAMLTFLQLVRSYIMEDGKIDKSFKAIYIAPMKALAQEVVTKFSSRLKGLGLVVREFTGDMQLTKQEISESQLLICTPEKYDVATRKGGDGSLGTMVSLIIIDEVHLIADERGAVLETIVARTQRYVESSQRIVRIVGLSATLPNYEDVATFLRVNFKTGLFYFGPEYRPIPLDQTFQGVIEKQRNKRNELMNKLAYEKMIAALESGKQLMIFVHSRKETSRTLEAIMDLTVKYGTYDLLENIHHEKYTIWKKQVEKSRNQEVQNLFYKGVGVHHAGMLRPDRSLVEQMFEVGVIKVLCCTATLAWGVNLPAHTVIIKGTEMYDPERGGFVDLSILDILQIFGRAGRPQYDDTGHAILITQQQSMNKYLGMLAQQAPIESSMIKSLADHMNAEIVNGTINNIKEAVSWLTYTFLFVRMRKNPLVYGIKIEDLYSDPQLEKKRIELVKDAANILDNCMMIRYDKRSGNLAVTDLGRIASHYYIKHTTIESFNHMLAPHLSEPEAIHVLCSSAEFDQLKVRPEELNELDELKRYSFINMKSTTDNTVGKVNILLQSFLNRIRVNSFTLQSDTNYVAQNAGRISRALFEISLKRGWSTLAVYYLQLCKSIDRKVRLDHSPLRQFPDLPLDILKKLEDQEATYDRLIDLDDKEIGELVHNRKWGSKIHELVRKLPMLQVEATVQPITKGIIKMQMKISCSFEWVDRLHGLAEPFWIWIEDGENEYIYHSEYILIQKKSRKEIKLLDVTLPVKDPLPPQYYIRIISDVWVGCESLTPISFHNIYMPSLQSNVHTDLLDLHPLPKSVLENELFEDLYPFTHFNSIQSQTFHTLYHTDKNVLVGAPTGSGKTITAELTILRLLRRNPGLKTIYVAPLKALARERLMDWQRKLGGKLGLRVLELTGEITPDINDLKRADILIVTPEKWDSISRGWQKRDYVKKVGLVIIDEIHLLGVDRGPVLEVIVSRMRFIAAQTNSLMRIVGLSTALANARDLGDWLGIDEGTSKGAVGLYNFRPSVRPVPMSIHIQGFPGKHYCPRMATMNKPAYAAILEHSPEKPVLIFVSSRRQTRLTALDLISYCASDDNPKKFLHMDEEDALAIAETLKDKALRDTLAFGVAIHHAGLDHHDRSIVEELFLNNKIQVLVCTSTLAWGVNLPCHLVIVKGTEFFDGKTKSYVDFPVTDILQMMGRAGRPQFDDSAVACIFVHEPKKNFYRKFLHEPFPVESSLHLQLHEHFNAEIANGSFHVVQDCIEYLTWTYFFRRLLMNPTYYGLNNSSPEAIRDFLLNLVMSVLRDLETAGCIDIHLGNETKLTSASLAPKPLGVISSYYYLHYTTPQSFLKIFQAQKDISINKIDYWIKVLCDAKEFSEIPVRHNEEFLNAELAESLKLNLSHFKLSSMDSSHTKAFLLIQAYLLKAKLPIMDYINDTKTVLDQVPRVLNSMIDIAAEYGFLSIVHDLMIVYQLISQGISHSSCAEWKQISLAIKDDVLEIIKPKYHIQSLHHLLYSNSKKRIETILNDSDLANWNADLFSMLQQKLKNVPLISSLKIRFRRIGEEGMNEAWIDYSPDLDNIKFSSETKYEFEIILNSFEWTLYGNSGNAPVKDISWWCMMFSNSKSLKIKPKKPELSSLTYYFDKNFSSMNLEAFKRIGKIKNDLHIFITIVTPSDIGNWNLSIAFENDNLIGLGRVISLGNIDIY